MIDAAPIQIVDVLGVRCFGCTFANILGIAPCDAIESDVRAVGRIVVCVEADAEVSTAITSSLSHGDPITPWATRRARRRGCC